MFSGARESTERGTHDHLLHKIGKSHLKLRRMAIPFVSMTGID